MASRTRAIDVFSPLRITRVVGALAVLSLAVLMLSPAFTGAPLLPQTGPVRALSFYALTAGAYCVLPFVRRGDIAVVAMWLVLAMGVSPCIRGEELSASNMFADMAGVALACGPIYIARFRQLMQGDVRNHRRRDSETTASAS